MIRTGYIVSLTDDHVQVQLDDLNCSRCEKGLAVPFACFPGQLKKPLHQFNVQSLLM